MNPQQRLVSKQQKAELGLGMRQFSPVRRGLSSVCAVNERDHVPSSKYGCNLPQREVASPLHLSSVLYRPYSANAMNY